MATLRGHTQEVSKVCFSPGGHLILTASEDSTARLWQVDSGECSQLLRGHSDEVFSCAFNYNGDVIVTASKDNTCCIWKSHR
ncbi:dynein assembly factor with WDR repeat domains 1-like [Nilaparvata lugens]|uniref:dynein assembly factor with WDR repeat domains 1-like n=1 Tax=Nilaparvata lugens TaxID=108931 RepID=UPI00193DEDCE|nr:dynein assembly factor with WDR repeat domains 1-like [Nilaparvata lugens]